jgi:chemotaxis protein histidine kinase CheA
MHNIGGEFSYSMPLAPEDRDSAYQLFVQEAVELFQQIEADLHQFAQDPSSARLRPVMQAAQIIRSGATQLNLTTLQSSVHRLEAICATLQSNLRTTDVELLCHASQTLKLSLLAHVQQVSTAEDIDCTAAQVILVQLEEQLQKQQPQTSVSDALSPAVPTAPRSAEQLTALAITAEVEDTLLQIKLLLASPPSETLATDLSSRFESLRDLGEMSNLSELVAISQAALASLQASPRTASTIGRIALAGYREAQPQDHEADSQRVESFPTKVQMGDAPNVDASTVVILNTADAFVWQTGSTIFVLPSQQVLEILIPTPDQVDETVVPPQLDWQERKLSVYPLTQFVSEPKASLWLTPSPSSHKQPLPLLVIRHRDQIFALKVEIERLITVSTLELQSGLESNAPVYNRGSTLLENDRLYAVVDVEMLLNQNSTTL